MNFVDYCDITAQQVADFIRPQGKPRNILQFAKTVKLPDGPKQGEYLRIESEPAQYHFLKAMLSGHWSRFVYVAPSQRGKTLISVLIPWMYSVTEENLSVGYVMPNLDKLSQNWEGKIKPAIIGAGFGEWLPTKGPGSKGGRPAALLLKNPVNGKTTVTYFMAGGTGARETSLSSVSPARIVIDEVDDFEHAGHVELAIKRLESWGKKGVALLASTVNTRAEREAHPILDFYKRADATRCRIGHKCPECSWYQIIKFDQLNLDQGRIACSHCGVIWNEEQRASALNNSELVYGEENIHNGIIASPPAATRYFSLLTTGFDYHMGDMAAIANTYRVAKDKEQLGDYSMMENFSHKIMCEPYTIPADHESITERMLALRSASGKYERGIVPDEVDRITIAIDVQADRIYWMAMGSGTNDSRFVIDWDEWFWSPKDAVTGKIIEPTDADRHAVLDRVRNKAIEGFPRMDGTMVKVALIGIDIGYNVGGTIGRWCFGKQGVIALRGDTDRGQKVETIDGAKISFNASKSNSTLEVDYGFYEVRKQEATNNSPAHWWFVKTQQLREHMAGRIRRDINAEGAMYLPTGLGERDPLIKHLASWSIIRDPETRMTRWVQTGRRDDYNDTACYNLAMLTIKPRPMPKGNGKIKTKGY